jgi:hypothetical protein
MNGQFELFGVQSHGYCFNCDHPLFMNGLLGFCEHCEEKSRTQRILRPTTVDNGSLPPHADAPQIPGVQLGQIEDQLMYSDDDDDFEPDFDDTCEFIREAAKNPPPGAVPAMRDAGFLPPLPSNMPEVEPLDDISDSLLMPGNAPHAPTVHIEDTPVQTVQPAREFEFERTPLPEYEPKQRKRPQTDMQDNYMEGYRPLKSRETGKVIKDEDGNDRQKHYLLGSHKRGVEDMPALAVVTSGGESPSCVLEEFKEMLKADGQTRGKKFDGSLVKYPGYLKVIFDNSAFFNTRSDLFKDGADAEAKKVIQNEALKRSLRGTTPMKKHITNLNHGYFDYKALVAKRDALIA